MTVRKARESGDGHSGLQRASLFTVTRNGGNGVVIVPSTTQVGDVSVQHVRHSTMRRLVARWRPRKYQAEGGVSRVVLPHCAIIVAAVVSRYLEKEKMGKPPP